ncbi:MAG: hypothetical protein ACKVE3_05020 [Dissulfuribacterales bacterium]
MKRREFLKGAVLSTALLASGDALATGGELKNSQPMESSINKFRTDRVETEKIGIMAGVINIAHFVIMG